MNPEDGAVWSVEDLLSCSRHEVWQVRVWAWERLAMRGDPALKKELCAALAAEREEEAAEAFRGLARLPREAVDAEVCAAFAELVRARGPQSRLGLHARFALLDAGDPETCARWIEDCRTGVATATEWLDLSLHLPDAMGELLREKTWLADPAGAPPAARAAVAFECVPEGLPLLHHLALGSPEEHLVEYAVARRTRSDMAPKVDCRRFNRARALAEHLADLAARRRSSADRALAARWESAEALRPIADALVHQRWSEAALWSRARLEELRRPDGPSLAARAYVAWVARQRRPDERMARTAVSLALGAVDGAILAFKPIERADPETRAYRALAGSNLDPDSGLSQIAALWSDPACRGPLAAALAQACAGDSDEVLRVRAISVLDKLPDADRPATLTQGSIESIGAYAAACALAAHPPSLFRLAREALPTDAWSSIALKALGLTNRREASEILRAYLARLAGPDGERLAALGREAAATIIHGIATLRDPSLLPALLDAFEPDGALSADVSEALVHYAWVASDPAWSRPEVRDAIDRFQQDDLPEPSAPAEFLVRFRCDLCAAEGETAAPRCFISRNLAARRAEGWDGIAFERVITCAACGARDRYTLTPDTRMRAYLLTEIELGVEVEVAGPLPLRVAGLEGRRASELLARAAAAAAAVPADAEALRRLGEARIFFQDGDAREPLAATFDLPCADLDFVLKRHDTLAALGDAALLERSSSAVAAAFSRAAPASADRRLALASLLPALRARGAATLTWKSSVGVQSEVLALTEATEASRLEALLLDPRVTAVTPGGEAPSTPGPVAQSLHGAVAVARALEPERALPAGMLPVLLSLAGRNDPCPCGSGKKFKKCHLQQA